MVAADLTIYDRMNDPLAAVKMLGEAIRSSGMFGVAGEKQGQVLAWECLARRQPPLTLAETYHVIHGRLSMKADKMLANFNDAGGKHKIVSRTAELATVELTYNGDTQSFSLSWKEAQEEPFVYNGKESEVVAQLAGDRSRLKIKDKYATPRARTQMLWARVISDGVRAMMPSANGGRYTPEEIDDDDLPAANRSQVVTTEVVDENTVEGQVVEEIAAADEPSTEVATEETNETSSDGFATAVQSAHLNKLYADLQLTTAQIENALKKRGAAANRSLKYEAAVELINTLQKALANKQLTAPQVEQAAAEVAGVSRQNPDNAPTNPGGPATPEQIEQAKALLKELNQTHPPTFNRWKAHMDAAGMKIADLSAGECAQLLGDLGTKNLAAFFDLSLQGWKPKQPAEPAEAAEGNAKN